MLIVRTRVGPSPIHGLGLFAAEPIPAGAAIWRFEPGLDLVIPPERVADLPAAARAFFDTYAYWSADLPDRLIVSCDGARFINHADPPNTAIEPFLTRAARDIAVGEEITCDYGAFALGWTGFDEPGQP